MEFVVTWNLDALKHPRAYFAYGITSRVVIGHVTSDVDSYEVFGLGTNAHQNYDSQRLVSLRDGT